MPRLTSSERMELWGKIAAADRTSKKELFLLLGKDLMASEPPKDGQPEATKEEQA